MSNSDKILWAFAQFGGRITLGQALQHDWGYKLTTRISELKKRGYPIQFIRGETASQNTWVLNYFDEKGQGNLL